MMTNDHIPQPRARFGVIADIHIDLGFLPPYVRDGRSEHNFKLVLEYMNSRGVDGVVLCGDMTKIGQISELKRVAEIWQEVFPGNIGRDGQHVEPLFVFGDHEIETFDSPGHGYEKWFEDLGITDKLKPGDIVLNGRDKVWKDVFGEEFAPIRRRTVRGYDFVLAHIVTTDEQGMRPGEPLHIPGLEEFFEANTFDSKKPFFYIQHKLPKGTVGAPMQSGQDSGRTTAILSKYPNAVGFCGHKHRSATEELSLWQGAFTQIEVPGVFGLLTEPGRENGHCSCEPRVADPPQQMPAIETCNDCAQALVMSIYDDKLVFEKIDAFHNGEAVAAPWIIKWPNNGSAAFAERGKYAAVPEFPNGSKVIAKAIRGKNRNGDECDQVEVRFPAARSTDTTPRAYDYEVTAILTKGISRRIVSQKRVYSPKCYLPERYDANEVICVFGKADLSDNHDSIEFEVRPANAWGMAGAAIRSEPGQFYRTGPLYPY